MLGPAVVAPVIRPKQQPLPKQARLKPEAATASVRQLPPVLLALELEAALKWLFVALPLRPLQTLPPTPALTKIGLRELRLVEGQVKHLLRRKLLQISTFAAKVLGPS